MWAESIRLPPRSRKASRSVSASSWFWGIRAIEPRTTRDAGRSRPGMVPYFMVPTILPARPPPAARPPATPVAALGAPVPSVLRPPPLLEGLDQVLSLLHERAGDLPVREGPEGAA